jgi:hypothetical protein
MGQLERDAGQISAYSIMFWPFWERKGRFSLVSTVMGRSSQLSVNGSAAHQRYDTKGVQALEY